MNRRALLAVVLSIAGIATDMVTNWEGPQHYWLTALLVTVGAPLLVLAASFTRAAVPVAVAVAIPFTLLALLLSPWGYGFWQLPTAVALWASCSSGRRRTPRTPA